MNKNRLMKKLSAVCLCVALLLSLTGCGSKTTSAPDSGDEAVALNILEINNNYFRNFTKTIKKALPICR